MSTEAGKSGKPKLSATSGPRHPNPEMPALAAMRTVVHSEVYVHYGQIYVHDEAGAPFEGIGRADREPVITSRTGRP